MVSRCFPGGYNVKLYISMGRLAWWLLAFLHSELYSNNWSLFQANLLNAAGDGVVSDGIVIFTGDFINKGPKNAEVLRFVMNNDNVFAAVSTHYSFTWGPSDMTALAHMLTVSITWHEKFMNSHNTQFNSI